MHFSVGLRKPVCAVCADMFACTCVSEKVGVGTGASRCVCVRTCGPMHVCGCMFVTSHPGWYQAAGCADEEAGVTPPPKRSPGSSSGAGPLGRG